MQDIDPRRYGKVYLITTPRLPGHHHAPASFWYLYSQTGALETIIGQVKNTFDERRMYVLHGCTTPSGWFRSDVFAKDLHVSPFSSRGGSYRVVTRDPAFVDTLRGDGESGSGIDVRVTLYSSEKRAKVYARAWSEESRIVDPETLSVLGFCRLFVVWFVLGRLACTLFLAVRYFLQAWLICGYSDAHHVRGCQVVEVAQTAYLVSS